MQIKKAKTIVRENIYIWHLKYLFPATASQTSCSISLSRDNTQVWCWIYFPRERTRTITNKKIQFCISLDSFIKWPPSPIQMLNAWLYNVKGSLSFIYLSQILPFAINVLVLIRFCWWHSTSAFQWLNCV